MFYQKLHICASSRDSSIDRRGVLEVVEITESYEVIACTTSQYGFEFRTILNRSKIGEGPSTQSFL